jgi:hypothetical protein
MTPAPAGVLRPGDRVRFDGADHLVVALTGTLVRLRSDGGTEAVVLAAYMMASPERVRPGGTWQVHAGSARWCP